MEPQATTGERAGPGLMAEGETEVQERLDLCLGERDPRFTEEDVKFLKEFRICL